MTINDKINVFPQIEKSSFPFYLLSSSYGIADSNTRLIRRENYESCTVEFVFEGRGFLEIENQSHELGKDSVYILHKGSNHQYAPDRDHPWKKIFFVVDGELMEYLFRIYNLNKVYVVEGCPHLREYFDEMFSLKGSGDSLHRQAAVIFHRLLVEMHAAVYKTVDLPPEELTFFKRYLDEGMEKKISIEKYCIANGASKAALIRRFKRYYNLSPYDYLMRKRIEAARLLLKHSALTVKEIAHKLQFCDQYHFSNYFKTKTGFSPKQYRRRTELN